MLKKLRLITKSLMMKNVLFVLLLAAISTTVNAQMRKHHREKYPHAEFGLKGGLNIANLHVQNTSSPDARTSLYLGGLAHIHLAEFFAVQPEIMFSGQGYKQSFAGGTYHYNINYINIPVLAQFMVGDGFRIETGPQLGILAAAHQKLGGTSVDIKDNFKPLDFAWVFGLGFISHAGFGIDARYNLGISNINNVSSTNVNNRVFAIGVFYQFTH